MAARIKADDLKKIIDTGKRTDVELNPMINTANMLVNELLLNEGYSTDHLVQIELWLAAHFVAIRDPKLSSDSKGGMSAQFQGRTGMAGLEQTSYGTQVMMLDYHGILQRAATSKGKVSFEALP
jgi:hypothetical protein